MYLSILPNAVIVIEEKKNHIYSNWVIQLFLNRALEDINSQGNRPRALAAGRRCMKGSAMLGQEAEICVLNSTVFHIFFHLRSNISPPQQTYVGPGGG